MSIRRRGRIHRSSALDAGAAIGTGGLYLVFLAVTGVFLARALGPAGKGVVTLVLGVIGQKTAQFFSLGVETALVHFGGRRRLAPGVLMRSALFLGLALGSVAASVTAVLIWTVFKDDVGVGVLPWTFAIVAVVPALTIALFVASVIQVQGRLIEVNVVLLGGAVLNTLAAAVVLIMGWGVGAYLLLAALAIVIQAVAMILLALRSGVRPHRSGDASRELITFGLRGHVGTIFQGVNDRLDLFMIALLLSVSDVGIYSVSVAAAEVLLVVPQGLSVVLLQRTAAGTEEEAAEITGAASRLSSATVAVGAIVLGLLAEPLIKVVFGGRFVTAAGAMILLLPGVWALGQWRVTVQALSGHGYPGAKSLSAGVGAALTIALDLLLIPRMGIEGAALASSIAYFAAFLVAATIARRRFGPQLAGIILPRKEDLSLIVSTTRSFLRSARRAPSDRPPPE